MIKKQVWMLLLGLTIFSMWFSYNYFEKAIPFVSLSITMDKRQAEQEAIRLSENLVWNTVEYDTAVKFEGDFALQAFVELEGGGKQAYLDMILNDYHQPYVWQVRFYKEKETREVFVWFTPDGYKYGFMQKLSDDMPGNNVSRSKAQSLAEKFVDSWGVDLKKYKQIEYEQKVQPSKRIDHSFIYERQDVALKKGLYRLKVLVAGDDVVGLKRYVKIPDEFNRRYAEMYSANMLLTQFASSSAIILYIFIIGLFCFVFLYKRRYFMLLSHAKMCLLVGFIFFISLLNGFPLIWNNYNTTSSKVLFLFQYFAMAVLSVALQIVFIGVIVLLAEAIMRYVFGQHVQFFKLWSRDTAGTWTILEQTMLGYCMAFVSLAYIVCFVMIATRLGWWYPLISLFDPNILSMKVPFLTPITNAFRAGFSEEFGFRVLPIAGALLLIRNFKLHHYWLIIVLIIQSLLFGAAHANYPSHPVYYRVVEMFFEFVIYGIIFYFFGVLPVIISHYVYDAVLMLIPVWTSSLIVQKIFGLICIGIPLWVVLFRILQQNGLKNISKDFYNNAWKPIDKQIVDQPYVREQGKNIPSYVKQYAYIFGLIGIILFGFSKDFQFDTPPLIISEVEAKTIARTALKERFGNVPGESYTELVSFIHSVSSIDGNKFIYQEYGKNAYEQLQGLYVLAPYYSVRYANFVGSVEERAEEYGVWISASGHILNVWHKLPEAANGADISEPKVESLAYACIEKEFKLSKKDVELISIDSVKHENRRDWAVVFRDLITYTYDKGQGRITLNIAGDQIVGMARSIYVPEEWARAEQERLVKKSLIGAAASWMYIFLLILFIGISFGRVGIQSIILWFIAIGILIFTVCKVIEIWLLWGQVMFSLNTLQPMVTQYSSLVMSYILGLFASGFTMVTPIVLAVLVSRKGSYKDLYGLIVPAVSLGCGIVGALSFFNNFGIKFESQLPIYSFVNAKYPALIIILRHFLLEACSTFIFTVAVMLVAKKLYEWHKSDVVTMLIFCLAGFVVSVTSNGCDVLWHCIVSAVIWGVIWYALCRYIYEQNIELLFVTIITMNAMRLIPSVWYGSYPGIISDFGISLIAVLMILIWIIQRLQKD